MANRMRLRPSHTETPEFGGEDMSDREWREYCRGIRIYKETDADVPFHVAMNETGEPTVMLAIQSAIKERESEE